MIRCSMIVLGLAGASAMADPPIPPDPPVHHSNQGRNVDQKPQIGSNPLDRPDMGDDKHRALWIPPTLGGDRSVDRLREPELPRIGQGNQVAGAGGVTVTPAPSTLGLLALGGLALSRRRRG